ncbi:MAG: hypothetical protein ABIR00_00260 [Nitrosospira sp.]
MSGSLRLPLPHLPHLIHSPEPLFPVFMRGAAVLLASSNSAETPALAETNTMEGSASISGLDVR